MTRTIGARQLLAIVIALAACHLAPAARTKPWSYEDWKPGGERTTLDGITFDSTIHCGNGHDFVKVKEDHYRFRARVGQRLYAWRFHFKITCPEAVGRTITVEVADLNHGGRQLWQENANVYSLDEVTWLAIAAENMEIVPWTPTGHDSIDQKYGDRSHVPYGVRFRLKLTAPEMWLAGPTPYTLQRRDQLMERLAAEYASMVEISTIGHGYQKHEYPIRMVRITAPGDSTQRENVFVISGEHCAETAGIYATEGWIEEVLEHPDWLKRYVFHFVPIVNVDGMYHGATYYNMGPVPGVGHGVNIYDNWGKLTEPETKAIWPLLVKLRPVFFASLHNGRHRRTMAINGPAGPGTDELLRQWRLRLGFEVEGCRSHRGSNACWGTLDREGITRLGYTIEVLLLCRQEGCDTFGASYVQTGRQLARGTADALAGLNSDSKEPRPAAPNGEPAAKSEPRKEPLLKKAAPQEPRMLCFNAPDFTAKLPWFYHGLPFDRVQEHDIHSFEVNALQLPPGDYNVALLPNGKPKQLAVGFDGRTFEEIPVENGRAVLAGVGIHNRMLRFYVKASGAVGQEPLDLVYVYPPDIDHDAAEKSAQPFKAYRRNTRVDQRQILSKENWPEFYAVLNRQGFGKQQLRAMFNEIVAWCKRRQVLDPSDIHYGAIYSEEDKYDFRDAAAAAVCFTYAWRDSGDEDFHRRAILARDYCYKGQYMDDPANKDRFGGFCHMVHGAWGKGVQRLGGDLGGAVGVENGIIANLLVKLIELGLEPSPKDLEHLRAAAVWMINNESAPGTFRHHEGTSHDCQNSNALAAEAIVRAYYALQELGEPPPPQWLEAARRGMAHVVQGQEAIGCWPYVFAKIGRGQAFSQQSIPDQGMGTYHFLVACDSPAFREFPGTEEALRRAARWWLCTSRLDEDGPFPTIDLDDREARGTLQFSRFTWCRFMAAASLMRIAELTGEKEPWQQLAMRYMEHVDTKLRNRNDPDKAPFKRASIDEMTLCSWIQAVEWAGVLLREMEERLPRLPINSCEKWQEVLR